MKKILGILAAVLIMTILVPKPGAAQATIDLGLKGGYSLSNMTWTGGGPSESPKWLGQPVFGAFLAINLNPTFSIQPEVFLWKGGVYDQEDFEGTLYRYELVLTYVHVPVLAKVHLAREGALRPVLFAGPAVSFLSKAVNKYYEDGALIDDDDVKEFLKGTDFSAVFGGGLEFYLDKIMLVLDVRYNLGLANVNNKGDETTAKNKAVMIMAGIGF
mgnify:CR=1 FL=1